MGRVSESKTELQTRTRSSAMYFDYSPTEIFSDYHQVCVGRNNSQEKEEFDLGIDTSSKRTKRMYNVCVLFSIDSPFVKRYGH